MARYIGVDLGTANTLIYLKGKGVVLSEPSVVAIDGQSGRILAVGNDAKNMIGRTPDEVSVVCPVKKSVIADFDVAQAMLRVFLEKACPKGILRPFVTICTPHNITEVERRAVLEAVRSAGGKNIYVIDTPMASAIGADLPVSEAVGSMVVDIGSGTLETAVLSFGGIVSSISSSYAGDKMDKDIKDYVKNTQGVVIGEHTAEEIKKALASAVLEEEEKTMSVLGRDLATGLPKKITVTNKEVYKAIKKTINKVIESIRITLENTPPELLKDISENGIVLLGGGAKLRGLTELIKERIGISAHISENAEECAVCGAGRAVSVLSEKGAKENKIKRAILNRL